MERKLGHFGLADYYAEKRHSKHPWVVCRNFSKKKDHGMWMVAKHSHIPGGSHGQNGIYRI